MNNQEIAELYDFKNKTVVITGGTGVLGGEMACALVGLGANVAVLDRRTDIPPEYQQPMDAGPGKYLVVYGDVLDTAVLEEAKAAIHEAFGPVDALINAAGGNHPSATTGPELAFFDLPKVRCFPSPW